MNARKHAPDSPSAWRRAMRRLQEAGDRTWLRYPLLALVWLVLWRLSALTQYAPHASLWFPPAGLTFAALLVIGWRAIPVLMVCAVTVTFWIDRMYQSHASTHELLLTGLVFGAVHCLSYGLGAEILRRIVRRRTVASLPAIITAFLILSCLSSLCAALSGVQSLQIAGLLDAQGATGLWLPWWIGDMAGTMVLAPLFLGLLSRGYPEIASWLGGLDFQGHAHPAGAYLGKLLFSVFLLSLVMLLAAHFRREEIAFGVFFLIVPQIWIVYTESPFRSALSLAVFSTAMALWMAALHLVDQALVYQFAICVIAASAYFGLAVPVLVASNKQLSEMAFNDGLTKVASKHYFFERSERTLSDTRRYGLPASLILLDIDRFKDINDSFGHAVGDQALVRLAMAVKMQLRQSDVFGRFGGDEFMLLLPGTNLGHALSMAERLRRLLHDITVPGTDRHLTASFGVVGLEPEETIMQAFKRADHLLLDAKRNGRNSIGSIAASGS